MIKYTRTLISVEATLICDDVNFQVTPCNSNRHKSISRITQNPNKTPNTFSTSTMATRNPHRVRMRHSLPHTRLKHSNLTAELKRRCSRLIAVLKSHVWLCVKHVSHISAAAGVLCLIAYCYAAKRRNSIDLEQQEQWQH